MPRRTDPGVHVPPPRISPSRQPTAMTQLRFALVFHNHQPIGNFDGVIEQAYQDSYLPFLDVFSNYTSLRISLHTSGSLFEWRAQHSPEYLARVGDFVAAGRIEIVGGAFFEPIL